MFRFVDKFDNARSRLVFLSFLFYYQRDFGRKPAIRFSPSREYRCETYVGSEFSA